MARLLLRRAGLQQQAEYSTAVAAAAAAGAARRLAFGVPAFGLGTFAAVTDEPHKVAYRAAMVPIRLGRDVVAAVSIVAGEYASAARLLPPVCRRPLAARHAVSLGCCLLRCAASQWRQHACSCGCFPHSLSCRAMPQLLVHICR